MRAWLLRIIALSSLLGACATQDSYIAEGWEASPQARSVLVVPTNFDLTPPTEFLLGVNMTTDAVCERFERSGRNVDRVSLGEVFEALGGAGGGVDPAPGADPSLRRSAVARVLAAAHDADLVVMPSVVIRDAQVRGRNFVWDGVSRPYVDGELAPGYVGYFGFTPEEAARYYTDAWAFVHLLNMAEKPNGERYVAGISAFIRALNRGKDWREAIESAFDMSLEDLDGRYREHRESLIGEGAKLGNFSIPDRDYSFSVAELPESVALVRLGDHALVLGESRLDLAERYFQRALEFEPAQIEAEIGSSLVSAQRGEFEEAEERLSLLSADGRLAASIHEARGIVALHQIQSEEVDTPWESGGRDVEAARRAFRQAVVLDPDRASAWLYLGSTYAIDPSSAALEGIVAFLKAEALQPGVLSAKLGLGVLYARVGRTSEARFQLERVVASHDEWHAREALRILEGLSDLEAASP